MHPNRPGRDQALTALLIAPDRKLAQQLVAALHETRSFQLLAELKAYPSLNTLEIRLRQLKPDVVLIETATNFASAAELVRFVCSWRPVTPVIGVHHSNDSAAVISVLRAGASEFLSPPFEAGSQREAANRVRRLRQPDQEVSTELGHVISFSSAKPGAGSSTIAAHTAHALRKLTGAKVLLIDFDLQGGTIGFYLKLQAAYSVVDALQQAERLDPSLWSALTIPSGGIDVLPAPELPFNDPIDQPRLNELIEHARRLYDWIILDTPTIFHRSSLLSLSEADNSFLVSTSDLASLHVARRAVQMLEQLGFARERYQVVINRLGKKDSLASTDLSRIFQCAVPVCIPNDYFTLHRVISLGQPLVSDCDLGRAIASLASHISGRAEAERSNQPASGADSRIPVGRTLEERA
ncbi:MAG: P-loop NTPase [Bryobacterales bacterium]|nr:P-loop NTPase [Bryobacterales bacterium]